MVSFSQKVQNECNPMVLNQPQRPVEARYLAASDDEQKGAADKDQKVTKRSDKMVEKKSTPYQSIEKGTIEHEIGKHTVFIQSGEGACSGSILKPKDGLILLVGVDCRESSSFAIAIVRTRFTEL